MEYLREFKGQDIWPMGRKCEAAKFMVWNFQTIKSLKQSNFTKDRCSRENNI